MTTSSKIVLTLATLTNTLGTCGITMSTVLIPRLLKADVLVSDYIKEISYQVETTETDEELKTELGTIVTLTNSLNWLQANQGNPLARLQDQARRLDNAGAFDEFIRF